MDGKVLAKNKKAYFDYEVLEKIVAGIILKGAEVKSVKAGHIQLKGSYVSVQAGRVWTENMHISPYQHAPAGNQEPLRRKELLLKRKEIDYLAGMSSQKGFALVPLEIILKKNLIKVIIGVCRGKKAHDKRQVLKRRAEGREIAQALKKFAR